MQLSPLVYWALSFVVVALVGLFISAKTIKIDIERSGDLIIAMLTILGTLVSVLLGLLVSSADEQYTSLESCVNSEATYVNQVFRLSRGLPPAKAHHIQDLCIEYSERVIADEWKSMQYGEFNAEVTRV